MQEITVGKRIREIRKSKSISGEVLAEKINVSARFIYDIETGKRGFSAETLGRISMVLDVSCDYILFGESEECREIEESIKMLSQCDKRQMRIMQQALKKICDIDNKQTNE